MTDADHTAPAPVVITSAPTDVEAETTPLFSIDGVTWRIPKAPRANLSLQLLSDVETYGPELANLKLLQRLVGEDGYNALAGCTGVTRAQVRQVSELAALITLGEEEKETASGN